MSASPSPSRSSTPRDEEPSLLIGGGLGSEVRFLDLHRGDLLQTLVLPQSFGHVNRLVVAPGKKQLAVAGNPHVACFDIQTARDSAAPLLSFEGHKGNVCALGFFEEVRVLYTGSEDGTIRVWDSRTGRCTLTYENNDTYNRIQIHSVTHNPLQLELVASDDQGRVLFWDLRHTRIRRTVTPAESVPIRSVCVSTDGRTLVCANHEGFIFAYQLDHLQEPLQVIEAHGSYVLKCLLSQDAKSMVSCSSDSTIQYWRSHTEGFARCFTLMGHTRWVWDCEFSADGQSLVSGSSDGTCRLWDVRSGNQRSEYTGFARGVTGLALLERAGGCGLR